MKQEKRNNPVIPGKKKRDHRDKTGMNAGMLVVCDHIGKRTEMHVDERNMKTIKAVCCYV